VEQLDECAAKVTLRSSDILQWRESLSRLKVLAVIPVNYVQYQ